MGAKSDERGRRVRRMDDVARVAAEDAVVAVLAGEGEADVAALAQAVEGAAVVPAAGFLAEVPADRALVAQLRARYRGGRLGEGGVARRTASCSAISAIVVRAPMRSPPSAVSAMPRSSLSPPRLTSVCASNT